MTLHPAIANPTPKLAVAAPTTTTITNTALGQNEMTMRPTGDPRATASRSPNQNPVRAGGLKTTMIMRPSRPDDPKHNVTRIGMRTMMTDDVASAVLMIDMILTATEDINPRAVIDEETMTDMMIGDEVAVEEAATAATMDMLPTEAIDVIGTVTGTGIETGAAIDDVMTMIAATATAIGTEIGTGATMTEERRRAGLMSMISSSRARNITRPWCR